METNWVDLAWQTLAVLTTLAIFSFLFGDNPIYKMAERLWVGVSTGYWTMLLYWTSFQDKVVTPIAVDKNFIYIIPTILGLLMWLRLFPKYAWISRYAIAFYIGISTGVFIPLTMKTSVFVQIEGAIRPITGGLGGVWYLVGLVGFVCSLIYFFFSKEHKGAIGAMSRVGIYTLMIGFGAGFGLTVMGRVALLVQRVTFLQDYFKRLFAALS